MQVCMKTGHGIKHFFNNNKKVTIEDKLAKLAGEEDEEE